MTVKICERHVTYTFFFNRESICGRVYKSCKSLVALYPLFFEEISILQKKKIQRRRERVAYKANSCKRPKF